MKTSHFLNAADALNTIEIPEKSTHQTLLVQNFYDSLSDCNLTTTLQQDTNNAKSEQDIFIRNNYITFVSMKRKRANDNNSLNQLKNQQF